MRPARPELSRRLKKLLLVAHDALAVPVALYLALVLRVGDLWPEMWLENALQLWVVLQLTALGLAFLFGLPSTKVSAMDLRGQTKLAGFVIVLGLVAVIGNLTVLAGVPRTVPIIFALLYLALLIAGRQAAAAYLKRQHRNEAAIRVAIYGAGSAGIQLNAALRQSREIHVVAMVDDHPNVQGMVIGGLKVEDPSALEAAAKDGTIHRILVAMPSVDRSRQEQIVKDLSELPCEVQVLPGYVDLLMNKGLVGSLRSVDAADLLGRSEVRLDTPDVEAAFSGASAMVTGAGGSIGSELCRQLLDCGPRRVVLYENNEFALFQIDRELREVALDRGIELVSVLGSVCDPTRVAKALREQEVTVVLHAAAYKHVPIVEENVLEGVKNNVIGTKVLAEAARDAGLDRFILVSTDKAVRPANVMGGTKRMAEILIQDLQKRTPGTKFSMVRFGNVLESSGSVVPIFRQQIASGGPVTVTHPEMTRYFMTVPEAARLVLLAGSYAEGGEVFVLDMGEPVRIADMARQMVQLSGLSVRDKNNPDGDIEIIFTGVRPGEKLYEELLIGHGVLPTPNPKIQRAEEHCPTEIEVAGALQDLQTAIANDMPKAARDVLARYAMVRRDQALHLPTHAAE